MIHRHSQHGQARMGEVGPEPSVDPKMAQIRQLQAAKKPWETPWILGKMLRIQEKHTEYGYVWKWGIPPIIAI